MIVNKVYTRDEMREERIISSDYCFIDKECKYLVLCQDFEQPKRENSSLFVC